MGPRVSRSALAAAIGLALTITGCSSSGDSAVQGLKDESASSKIKVGVIVSDPANSARWDEVDQPLLTDAMVAEGLEPDVQNSADDASMFTAIADSMISSGVRALVISAPNNEVSATVVRKARARNIPTIDYDPDGLNFSGSSDYAVSFNPVQAGDLQGRGLVRGIRGVRAEGADIIEIDGPVNDPTTRLLAQGARNVLQPRYDSGAYRLVASQSVDNDQRAGALFEQLLNANGDHVDGVLAINDAVASEIIAVLRKKALNGKVRVTGLGATPDALKAILRGDQFMTVFPAIAQQATTTAKLAGALARSDHAAADKMVSMTFTGPTGNQNIRAVLVPPAFITSNTVKQVVDSRVVDSREICDTELILRCDQLDIPR